MTVRVLQGDCRDVLKGLKAGSVHCVVTSPPYWGLRDYGTGVWEGGDPDCDHSPPTEHQKQGTTSIRAGRSNVEAQRSENIRGQCQCGARRIDRQIGLETSPAAYVAEMVAVFREVWRVLRPDGTAWLNLGDSYATGGGSIGRSPGGGEQGARFLRQGHINTQPNRMPLPGLKPKDLIGIPCDAAVVPCTILDPFGGAGTTGLVADRMGRDAILIELNPEYAAMGKRRVEKDAGLFASVSTE